MKRGGSRRRLWKELGAVTAVPSLEGRCGQEKPGDRGSGSAKTKTPAAHGCRDWDACLERETGFESTSPAPHLGLSPSK